MLLRGEKPDTLQGNVLISRVLGAETRFFSEEEFQNRSAIETQLSLELQEKGFKPYFIPIGASTATGSLGYIRMVQEIVKTKQTFDHIYCTLGSGGTFASILLGQQYFQLSSQIHGIAVCDDVDYFLAETLRIQKEFDTIYNIPLDLTDSKKMMDDQYTETIRFCPIGSCREAARTYQKWTNWNCGSI